MDVNTSVAEPMPQFDAAPVQTMMSNIKKIDKMDSTQMDFKTI
jgi:hypothetical protein